MWRALIGVQALAALLLLLTGCYTTPTKKVPPPTRTEIYETPPTDDSRFDKPPQYPADTLNKDDPLRKDKEPGTGGPGGSSPSRAGGSGKGGFGASPGGY